MFEQMIAFSDTATAAAAGNGMTALQSLGLGGAVALLGIAIVFIALIMLVFITWLYPKFVLAVFPKVAAAKAKKAQKKAERLLLKQQNKDLSAKPADMVQKTDTSAAAAAPVGEEADPALIAVITAAVAASLGKSSNGIIIKSLRRSHTNVPAWGTSGRIEQVTNRL